MNSNETADKIFKIYYKSDGEMLKERDLKSIEGYKYTSGDKTPILSEDKKNQIKAYVRSLNDPIIRSNVDWDNIGNSDFTLSEAIQWLGENPEIAKINMHKTQKFNLHETKNFYSQDLIAVIIL